jgi:hypothetical protein
MGQEVNEKNAFPVPKTAGHDFAIELVSCYVMIGFKNSSPSLWWCSKECQSSTHSFLLVFICDHSWNSYGTKFCLYRSWTVCEIPSDNQWESRSCFIVYICPSSIKQMTPLTRLPFVHGTFPIHFDKLAMDFSRRMLLRLKIESPNTLHSWLD